MNLLARFEGVAEMLFTGAFKKNASRLQPVEIAKELAKAMFKNKQVSISQVYVPNVYRVFLHADDWGPLASFGDTFLLELSKYLYADGGGKLNFSSPVPEGRNYEYGLEVIEGPDKSVLYHLNKQEMYLGRHAQCEIVLRDPQVSRRHLKITETDQGWMLDDLGSTNGTLVNGQRITREMIAPGDKIQLGQTILVIKRLSGD